MDPLWPGRIDVSAQALAWQRTLSSGICPTERCLQQWLAYPAASLVEILEIFKTYEDGRMDIKTIGHKVFKVDKYTNPWPEKLYAGGYVDALENIWDVVPAKFEMVKLMDQLYEQLQISDEITYDEDTPVFALAHKVGLSIEQEYELIQIPRESERVNFLVAHLQELLPRLTQAEEIRQRIKMNGHFRQLDSLDF